MYRAVDRWLHGLPRTGVWALSLFTLAAVASLDFATGPELSPALFYLGPVALAAWYAGRRMALVVALLSGGVVYVADRLSGGVYSHLLVPIWNSGVRLGIFILAALLLSGLRRALEQERERASTDPLTGVANNRAFYQRGALEITRARRYRRPLTLAYMDLDNFKRLNDESGHSVGDDALRVVAETMRVHLRTTDLVARMGGDEFAILLPETDEPAARAAFGKLQPLLLQEMAGHGWPVTFSIGVVTTVPPPISVDDLIRTADQLMYQVKRSSKDGVRFEVRREATPAD